MTIEIILDEVNTLTFGTDIKGASTKRIDVRFVVEGHDMDYSFGGKYNKGQVIVDIPILAQQIEPDSYRCRLEFILEGEKYFNPMITDVNFIMPTKVTAGIVNTSTTNYAKRNTIDVDIKMDDDNITVETAVETKSDIETKNMLFDIKNVTDDGSFEGYGSVFGVKDSYNDIVERGAFKKTLNERQNVKLLWQHDQTQPIGMFTEMYEDDHGLVVKGQLALGVQKAQEAHALMKMGALDGLSIGYSTVKEEKDRKSNTRHLKELKLFEVSVVTFPANEASTVTSVKESINNKSINKEIKDDVSTLIDMMQKRLEPVGSHSDDNADIDIKQLIKSLQTIDEPVTKSLTTHEADKQ